MNKSDTEHKSASGALLSNTAHTHLTGSRHIIARIIWLVLVIPSIGLFVVSLLVTYQQMQTVCVNPITCNANNALSPQLQQSLTTMGFSVSAFAVLVTIFFAINAAIWYGVGFLIFWRRSNDWLALLAAFYLVMFNTTNAGNTSSGLAAAYPILSLPLSFANFLGGISLVLFFLLFPNGRFVPRWTGLFLIVAAIDTFSSSFPSITSPFNAKWPEWFILGSIIVYGVCVFSQIYRYRRVSTPVQRQQTKWIILGVAVAMGVIIGLLVISAIIPPSVQTNNLGVVVFFLTAWPTALLLIPLSIGFSILRYRLWDIDRIINRTLVYGVLTLILLAIYLGLIFGLQYLLRGIISQKNDVAIVVSTLAIAGLFQPLRHRIQAIIDRRFYRRKYDAAKIVEAFSATLRNEVDLSQLREHLLTVVQDTMQPNQVSLWLREPERKPPHPDRM